MTLFPTSFAKTGIHVQATDHVVTRFQVLGERSSGTNLVKRLFGRNTALRPTEALGWKHGGPQVLAVPADLLVIVVVRNAANWALSMHAKPWHAVAALQALEFSDFLRSPWLSVIDRERYFDIPGISDLVGQPLQADRDPVSGAPYANLMALRRGKLAQHLGYLNRGCATVLLRMEVAQDLPELVLDEVLSALSLPARDGPFKPVVKRLGSRFKPAVAGRPATPENLSAEDLGFLRRETDTELEAALGYVY